MRKISYPSLLLAAIFSAAFNTARAEDIDVSDTYFSNLDFESCVTKGDTSSSWIDFPDGNKWTLNYNIWSGDFHPVSTSGAGASSLVSGYYVTAYNQNNTMSSDVEFLQQTSGSALPAGTYTVSVVAHTDASNLIALYATAGTTTQTATISKSSSWSDADTYSVVIELSSASTLTIGLKTIGTSSSGTTVNLYCDNFKVVENATGTDDSWSSSEYFSNLDFESCYLKTEGQYSWVDFPEGDPWNLSYIFSGDFHAASTSSSGASSLVTGNYYVTAYNKTNSLSSGVEFLYQTSSSALPAGKYTVSVVAHTDAANLFALYASDGTTTESTVIGTTSGWSSASTYSVTIELSTAASLTIGLKTVGTSANGTEVNLYCDNFTVVQDEAYTGDDGETDDGFTDDYDGTWNDVSDYFTNLDFDSSTIGTDSSSHQYVEDCSPWDTTIGDMYFSKRWTTKDETHTQTPWPVIKSRVNNPSATPSSGVKDNYMYAYTGYDEGDDGVASQELNTVPANTYMFFQTSGQKVPAGTYTISAIVHADGTDAFALYAIGTTEETTPIESSTTYSDAKRYFVTITLTKSVYLEIGIKTTAEITTEANLYADDFKVVLDEAYDAGSIAAGEDVWMESTDLYSFNNLDFESYTADTDASSALPNWTPAFYATDGTYYTMHCVTKDGDMSSYVDGYVFESWVKEGHLDVISGDFLYQTVEVPAGYYIISAAVHCDHDGIYLFASDGTTDFAIASCPIGNKWVNAKLVTISFRVEEQTNLKFGLRSTIETNASLNNEEFNIYADNFEIYDERCVAQVTDAGYATYFSNHSYLMPDGLEGATITDYEAKTDVEGITGTLEQTWKYSNADGDDYTEEVPKMTALLLRGDPKTYYAHITHEGDGTDTMNPDDSKNYLRGSATETTTTGPDNAKTYVYYMLSYGGDGTGYEETLGFYYQNEDGEAFTSEAHKAWLPIESGSDGAKLIGFTLGGGNNDTTGITAVKTAANDTDAIYNLQGMRVSDTSKKGLYIVGGRKVIVK